MNQAVAVKEDVASTIENVIARGDLSKLNPEERTRYYVKVCESVGLNPLTRPFDYLTLNGKLVLYAKRDATDQLRSIHNISVTDMVESERDGVYIVTAKVQNGNGRTDMAKGAVTLGQAKGDILANLIMKCETKAKRRATLSICGLGFLDETEVETIPANGNGKPPRTQVAISANAARKRDETRERIPQDLAQIASLTELERYKREVLTGDFMASLGTAQYGVEQMVGERENELKADADGVIHDEEAEVPAEPQTRAEYIQACHAKIEAIADENGLIDWWNAEKAPRRRFSLTQKEVDDLKARLVERQQELSKPNVLAAG